MLRIYGPRGEGGVLASKSDAWRVNWCWVNGNGKDEGRVGSSPRRRGVNVVADVNSVLGDVVM